MSDIADRLEQAGLPDAAEARRLYEAAMDRFGTSASMLKMDVQRRLKRDPYEVSFGKIVHETMIALHEHLLEQEDQA